MKAFALLLIFSIHAFMKLGIAQTVEAMFVVQVALVKISSFSELFNLKPSLFRGRLPTEPVWVLWLPAGCVSVNILHISVAAADC